MNMCIPSGLCKHACICYLIMCIMHTYYKFMTCSQTCIQLNLYLLYAWGTDYPNLIWL